MAVDELRNGGALDEHETLSWRRYTALGSGPQFPMNLVLDQLNRTELINWRSGSVPFSSLRFSELAGSVEVFNVLNRTSAEGLVFKFRTRLWTQSRPTLIRTVRLRHGYGFRGPWYESTSTEPVE